MKILHRMMPPALIAAMLSVLIPGRAAEPDPAVISYTLPDKIVWGPGGSGNDAMVLQGDPAKPGIYIQLLRWRPGNMSRPHFHNSDRFFWVVSGTWWIGTGPKFDPASMFPIRAGSYVVHHANQIHYDGAKDVECVLYVVGVGPVVTTDAEQK